MTELDTVNASVPEKPTLSLFIKPQIPAATSQANRMTRQAKNCRDKNVYIRRAGVRSFMHTPISDVTLLTL